MPQPPRVQISLLFQLLLLFLGARQLANACVAPTNLSMSSGVYYPSNFTCATTTTQYDLTFNYWTPQLFINSGWAGKNPDPTVPQGSSPVATILLADGSVPTQFQASCFAAVVFYPFPVPWTGLPLSPGQRSCVDSARRNTNVIPANNTIYNITFAGSADDCCLQCTNDVQCKQWFWAQNFWWGAGSCVKLPEWYDYAPTVGGLYVTAPSAGWGVAKMSCSFKTGSSAPPSPVKSVSLALTLAYEQDCDGTGVRYTFTGNATTILPDFPDQPSASVTDTTGNSICGGDLPSVRPLLGTFALNASKTQGPIKFEVMLNNEQCFPGAADYTGNGASIPLTFNCTSGTTLKEGPQDVQITAIYGAGNGTGRCVGFKASQSVATGNVTAGPSANLTNSGTGSICPGATQLQATFAYAPAAAYVSSAILTATLNSFYSNNAACVPVPANPTIGGPVVVTCTAAAGTTFPVDSGVDPTITLTAVVSGTSSCSSTTKSVSRAQQMTATAFTGVSLSGVSGNGVCAPAASVAATFSYVGTGVGAATFTAVSVPASVGCLLDVASAAPGESKSVTVTCTPSSPWPAGTNVVITLTAAFAAPPVNPNSCPASSVSASRTVAVSTGPVANVSAPGTPPAVCGGPLTATFSYVANNLVATATFSANVSSGATCTAPSPITGATPGTPITVNCPGTFPAGIYVITLTATYAGSGGCSSSPVTITATSSVTVSDSPVGTLTVGATPASICSGSTQALATFAYSVGATAASTALTAQSTVPGAACTATPNTIDGAASSQSILVSCTKSPALPPGTTMTILLLAQYTAVASCGGSPGSVTSNTSVAVPGVPAVTLPMTSNPAKCSPTTSVLATFTYNAANIGATTFLATSTTLGVSCSPDIGTLPAIGAATSNSISVTCSSGSGSNIPEGSVPITLTANFGASGSCSASSVASSTTVAVAGSARPTIALSEAATTDCYLARSVSKTFRLTNVGSTVALSATLDSSSAGCSVQPASVTADGPVTVTCNTTSGLSTGPHTMLLTGAYGAVGSCVPAGSTAGSATVTIAAQPTLTVAQNGLLPPACSTGGATSFVTTATYTVTGAGSSPIVTVVSATPSVGGGTCTGSVTTPAAASGTVSLNCTGTFTTTTDVVVSMQLSAQASAVCGSVFANGTSAIRVGVSNNCSNFCELLVQPLGATSQCLNGKELLASFRYIAYGTKGRVQFAPRTAPPFASCTVNPPYADGAQAAPGLLVNARCVWPDGSFFPPGPNPVTLAANLMTDLASCGGSVSVSGTSVVVIPQVKLTQTMVYRLGICDKDTSARIAYSFLVEGVAAGSIQFFQPRITTSSPQLVACSPTITTNPDGISGNMVIDCLGKFQGPGLTISVLLAAQPFGCSQDAPVGAASYFIGVGPCDVIGCNDAPSGGGAIWETGCAGKLAAQTCSGRCDMAAGVTGTAVATCSGVTGLWTITTPCTPIRNGTALSCVSPPTGGFADWSSSCPGTAIGNTCSGVCLSGYSAAGGSPSAQCGVNGVFVISVPCTKNGGSTTPPTWTSQPQDLTVDATTVQGTVVIFTNPTASDLTGIAPTVVCTPGSGALFPAAQTTTVACVATNTAGLTATTSFKVTVRPFSTIQCLNQPPRTPPNSEWRCNQPTNSGTWCTATCINGATASNPPLAALCSAGVWSINAGSCDGGAPQSAYYFVIVGLSQSSLTPANLAEFQAALWEALGRSIPLESIIIFVPSFASRAAVRRAANRAKEPSLEITAASTPGNAVIGVKFLGDASMPSQAQLDAIMRSQATTVAIANGLAQAGSSLKGPASSSPNSLGASDGTGNLLTSATPIVNCPAKLVRAAAAMPTCLNAIELTATFTYTADVTVTGLTTFAGAVPSITNANCRVTPRSISGPRTTGATVTVACSRADGTAFSPGSAIVYLTTKTLGGACAGSAAASAAIPAPYMTIAKPDEITQCGPVQAGSVTINFPYTVVGGPSIDAGTYLFVLPSVSASSSGVSCKPDIKPGTGRNSGVVPVTCTGRFPVSSLDVTLKLSVKQQNCLGVYGVNAMATAKVVTRCCPDTSKSGPAYLRGVPSSRCANEAATCEEGGKAFVARGPGSGTLQHGALLANCGTSGLAQVATVSASCSGSNMLFNVTNFKDSAGLSLKFWVACNRPVGLPGTGSVTSSVCAGWRQLPTSATVAGNDRQTSTSWAWPLSAGTCQCNLLYWSVFETSSQYSLPPVGC